MLKKSKIFSILLISIVIITIINQTNIVRTISFPKNNLKYNYPEENEEENLTYNLKKLGQYDQVSAVVNVKIVGEQVFIADEEAGLQIVNITNKAAIHLINSFQKEGESVFDVEIKGNYCFLAHGRAGVVILNIENYSDLQEISNYDVGGIAWKLFLQDELLFVVNRNYGIDILDISTIEAPQKITRYEGQPLDVFVRDQYMFVAAGISAGLEVVNVGDLNNIHKVAELKTPMEDSVEIDLSGKHAFIATRENGLKIVDIANPKRPKLVSYYKDVGLGKAWGVEVKDNFAYIADEADGLEIIDFTNIHEPQEVGQYVENEQAKSFGLSVENETIFLADYTNGLEILTWKVAQPIPTTENYVIIDQGELNFNHTVGPFELDTIIGNETLALNISLYMDVGLKSPLNVTVEAPENIGPSEDINLRIRLTAEASTFWAAFRGSLSFITPIGASEEITLKDAGIPEEIDLAAFTTFIGRNLTLDTTLEPFLLWQQNILNYTLKFTMTPYFNVTGTATVAATINNEGEEYHLDWDMDKEQLIIPITIPNVKEYYGVPLENFQFEIDDLRLDFYKLRFALTAAEIVELYNWTIYFDNFTNPLLNNQDEGLYYINQPTYRTLLFLDGNYSLGDYLVIIYFTKGFSFPAWGVVLLLLAILTLLAAPWVLIMTSSRRKQRVEGLEEREEEESFTQDELFD